jgi:hypothetical protein
LSSTTEMYSGSDEKWNEQLGTFEKQVSHTYMHAAQMHTELQHSMTFLVLIIQCATIYGAFRK